MHRRPKVPTNPKLAIGYVRVSTDEQTLGPEAQRTALAEWCKSQGVELAGVHQDLAVSGGAPLDRRPGLMGALAELRVRRAGVLLVAKRDRLARDVLISGMVERLVERAGARILAADGTGNGNGPEAALTRNIFDAFGQYERALIQSRVRSALAVKRARNECIGGVPFGHHLAPDQRTLELDAEERRIIEVIRQLRSDGATYRAIAERLNTLGFPARGQRWHPTTVVRILRRDHAEREDTGASENRTACLDTTTHSGCSQKDASVQPRGRAGGQAMKSDGGPELHEEKK